MTTQYILSYSILYPLRVHREGSNPGKFSNTFCLKSSTWFSYRWSLGFWFCLKEIVSLRYNNKSTLMSRGSTASTTCLHDLLYISYQAQHHLQIQCEQILWCMSHNPARGSSVDSQLHQQVVLFDKSQGVTTPSPSTRPSTHISVHI